MNEEEIFNAIALTQIPGLGSIGAKNLINMAGSATAVFQQRKTLPDKVKGISNRLVEALDSTDVFLRAEKELQFIQKNHIKGIPINDTLYPSRLRECDDAPTILFFRGETDFNQLKVISIVGTRNITDYGKQLCEHFLLQLKEYCPDVLVVSGLAYGVDICAHRAALDNQFDTVGVLAHGLDRIYPSVHRTTAVNMLQHGGLLTEYLSETKPDRPNFIRRNRIVAGISDATIVVESALKGGALITADIAESYHRDCFAFPGRVNDEFSQGCNNLIRNNKAVLIQSAEDFVKAMCWDIDKLSMNKSQPIQQQLFIDLTNEEQFIVDILRKEGNKQINSLVVESDIPINKINVILFELEMKGVIKVMAGGMYQLVGI